MQLPGDACDCAHPQNECFPDRATLRDAIAAFMTGGGSNGASWTGSTFANTYGVVMNEWCTGLVDDFDYLFRDLNLVVHGSFGFGQPNTFNEPIDQWDTSSVTSMAYMFAGCDYFNQPLNSWDVSAVTSFDRMFYEAKAFNQPLDSWTTSSATTMSSMFEDAFKFNQPIGTWDVQNVESLVRMFSRAFDFDQELKDWDVSAVTDMRFMFWYATAFNQDISGWNIGGSNPVTDMTKMFNGAAAFRQNLCSWRMDFPYSAATDIFTGTACDNSYLVPDSETYGNFCTDSCPPVVSLMQSILNHF